MPNLTRRLFLAAPALLAKTNKPTDIRIEDIQVAFEDIRYRFPYKFGGVAVDRATLVNVTATVRTRNGKVAKGFGSMPLGNVWSFPSKTLPYDTTLGAMRKLASRLGPLTAAHKEYGHPIEINTALEPQYLKASHEVDPAIPKLCTLVTASAFDAAIHDAFGKVHNRNCYDTYGPDLLGPTLDAFLGKDFANEHLDKYILKKPRQTVNLYHSVGGADPLTTADIIKPVGDGLPETLPEWIKFNGLHHIKIKLQGDELKWDIERVVSIDRIANEARPDIDWRYCVDFNERCPNIDYLLEFLRQVKAKTPKGFERIEYIEQPTARDLKADRRNVMHEAAKLRPVVIDESLTDLETLLLAPLAVGFLLWQQHTGAGALGHAPALTQALVLSAGVITALPLLLFAYGARRIRLSTLGLLQYLAPTVQFAIGLWIYHEPFSHERATGFAFIWLGLALYTTDNLWSQRAQS